MEIHLTNKPYTLYICEPFNQRFNLADTFATASDRGNDTGRCNVSMALCKTAVSPVCQQWGYCSLALSYIYITVAELGYHCSVNGLLPVGRQTIY